MIRDNVFATTMQKTDIMLAEIEKELCWDNRHYAYDALRAVLQALRDRLPLEEAVDLGSQLPMLVRGFYFEGWQPAQVPEKMKRKDFLRRIEDKLVFADEAESERIAKAVFSVLKKHISVGEMEDVRGALPENFDDLFPK